MANEGFANSFFALEPTPKDGLAITPELVFPPPTTGLLNEDRAPDAPTIGFIIGLDGLVSDYPSPRLLISDSMKSSISCYTSIMSLCVG